MATANSAIYATLRQIASYVVGRNLVERPVEITWANNPAGMRDKNLKEPFRERFILAWRRRLLSLIPAVLFTKYLN